jgi:serine/threonine-protein kinase
MERPGADLPPRVGRYEILARLDTGGMAEILLGRVTGPMGFERAVVIKRILPHLARDPSFVEMFLDEARIIAAIRHPNVVQVQDLASEGEDLFLVFEYLEGESASALIHRLRARARTLSPAVCAYIAAEACAGLHAAHELKRPDGTPQDLVHRDVSPANLFIAYDGSIKVIDFGIAKAADRDASTQAGQVKGKLAYMSPEQAGGRELDRRSDVYSLGVTLYELSTGTNPFRRASDVATLEAIRREPLAPPSSIVPTYPRELEAVCTKALARDAQERYATAADMRRDLLGVLRALDDQHTPEDVLADLMAELFEREIADKRELLQRMRVGEPVSSARWRAASASASERSETPTAYQGPTTARTRSSRRTAALALAGVAALAGIGLFAGLRMGRRNDASEGAGAACTSSALKVADLRVAWTTPSSIRWSWDVEGAPNDLLRFELVVGTDLAAVEARARSPEAPVRGLKVWTEADNPELGRLELPRTEGSNRVTGTLTDGHDADTLYHARLVAVDARHCRAISGVASGRTGLEPSAEVVLFHDGLDGQAMIRGREDTHFRVTAEGPHHAGSGRHLEYAHSCPPGQSACWASLELEIDQPLSLLPGQFAGAIVEFALSCAGREASYWSELLMTFGKQRPLCADGCSPGCENHCEGVTWFEFSPFAVACGSSGYRVVQVPLRALHARTLYECRRRGPCLLTRENLAAGKVSRFTVGGVWPRDAVVRIDEIRIRW